MGPENIELVAQLLRAQWRQQTNREGPDQSPHADQRPDFYFPGLASRPWWKAEDFSWVSELEANYDVIKKELMDLVDQGFLAPPPIEQIAPEEQTFDQQLLTSGAWELYRLYYNGVTIDGNCERCPETTRLFQSIPGFTGTVAFGVAAGGTHIQPHFGVTNAKLRCHLGLVVPPQCWIRAGKETQTWEEGKCLIFDDSFEHEVGNESDDPRYILLLDVHHPDMTADETEWIEQTTAMLIQSLPAELRDKYLTPATPVGK